MPPDAFPLNTTLDISSLAAAYAANQRLQIRDVFEPSAANEILMILERDTDWGLAFNEGNHVVQLAPKQLAALSITDRTRIATVVADGARKGYQFLYSFYPIVGAYFNTSAPDSPLFRLFEWLNSPKTLDFMRQMTGISDIVWADSQATRYTAGHFLKYHTDETPSEKRLAAYVFNFTRDWGRDWGGYLQFFDEKYDISEGFRPIFNALNIFTVPAHHSVGMVAPYVMRDRLSITGWLRGDKPPGTIGRT